MKEFLTSKELEKAMEDPLVRAIFKQRESDLAWFLAQLPGAGRGGFRIVRNVDSLEDNAKE